MSVPVGTIDGVVDFPPMVPGEPIVVSATTYTTYLRCPEQARSRLTGIYPEESQASFKGILAHRVFARHLAEGEIPEQGLVQVCREEIGKSLNPKLVSLGLKPSRLRGVVNEVGDLYARFKRFPTEGFTAAEHTLEARPAEGVTLRGVVDAVFGAADDVRIVDWKTGGLVVAEPQLDFYGLLWALVHGTPPAEVEAASVATGERYTARPSSGDLAVTAGRVAGLVNDMRTAFAAGGELDRVGGPWCRHCPLLDDCSEGRAATRH